MQVRERPSGVERGDEPTARHPEWRDREVERAVREFKPDDAYIMRWVRALVVVGGAVVMIVLGTVGTLSWLDSKINTSLQPVHRRLDKVDDKLEAILERLPKKGTQ